MIPRSSDPTANQHPSLVYPAQALTRLTKLVSGRGFGLLNVRPQEPSGLFYENGTLRWEEPHERANVTHYIIRSGGESNVFAKVPVGQTTVYGMSDTQVFISSFNERSGLEGRRVSIIGTGIDTSGQNDGAIAYA